MNLILNSRYRYFGYLLLMIPVFIFRDYTPPNELKYISIVEEALQNGTWFTFYNHGEMYADKPPLFFWLIMLSKLITGGYSMWIIGLFSLLPSIGVLAIMDKWLREENVEHNIPASNLMLLTTAMFLGGTMIVRMDMLMTFFIVLSLYTFYRIYKDKHTRIETYLLPVYIFLSVFSKGPMGFLIPVVSMITFLVVNKKISTIGRYLGWQQWSILIGLCVIWFSFVYLESGKEYLNNILFRQTVGRGINSFHHKEPIWFYLPRVLWTFAPWSLLYITLIWLGIRKKMITTDIEKFFITITGVNLVMLSLVSSKLDIYMLPIYPFIVYLCSMLIMRNQNHIAVKTTVTIPAVLFLLVLPSFFIFKDNIPYADGNIAPVYIGLVILCAGGIMALVMLRRGRTLRAITAVSAGMLGMVCSVSFTLPQFNQYIGFGEMARVAKQTALQENIDHYAYYKFSTAANMDVYLEKQLDYIGTVSQLDSLDNLPHKSILFVRAKELSREKEFAGWISNRSPGGSTGEYSWYIVGKGD